jgi:hypothetical protein
VLRFSSCCGVNAAHSPYFKRTRHGMGPLRSRFNCPLRGSMRQRAAQMNVRPQKNL